MLRDDYALDDGTISFLQELCGVSLITKKPRSLGPPAFLFI
jgi:hypothetical protein